jgi:alkylresorcinol/alkylpyrone synthase
VACIAVEICSSAFYLDDDPGVLVSLCLFADGASASIWSGQPGPTGLRCTGFDTLHLPADRECLRFENRGGKLRNRLDKTVPERAAVAVRALYDRQNGAAEKFSRVLAHAGGKKVLEAVGGALGGKYPLAESAEVLRHYGNMSSPSVLFALGELLRKNAATSGAEKDAALDSWLVSFGAGFSAHSCRVSRG